LRVTLDCSNQDTAFASLTQLLAVSEADLRQFSKHDVNWHHPELTEGSLMLASLGFDEESVPQPETVRWFHATRVPKDTTFEEGIIPFDSAVEKVLSLLAHLGSFADSS
jgi:hypothetical protein